MTFVFYVRIDGFMNVQGSDGMSEFGHFGFVGKCDTLGLLRPLFIAFSTSIPS